MTIPNRSANMKPLMTSPPKMNMASNTTNVVPVVLTVRASVELTALLMLSFSLRLGYSVRFSRIRSKITTVLLME